ncbi:MAG: hypothetical protein LUC88_01025 [Prevotella sp.]|nr:hypothetical protein [Prevotella sp.]
MKTREYRLWKESVYLYFYGGNLGRTWHDGATVGECALSQNNAKCFVK